MKKLSLLLIGFLCFGAGKSNAQYKDLHDFYDTVTNGAYPAGSLIHIGVQKKFFGMTPSGGRNNKGLIFSIDTVGTHYRDLFDFNGINGQTPQGSLLFVAGKFYGMTTDGGAHDSGLIFSIDTNGTGFKDLLDFGNATGGLPYGSLIISGNKLFGLTVEGGAHNGGTAFSIDTDGTGFKKLLDFTSGAQPHGDLLLLNGLLYGMTSYGGGGWGNIFSIDTNGSGFRNMYDFNRITGGYPYGTLTYSAGILYGTTSLGGDSNRGVVFAIDTDGSGFKDLYTFTTLINGYGPSGNITVSGGKLFGDAGNGGLYNGGTIFCMNLDGSSYSDLYDFPWETGSPVGGMLSLGDFLYGMTQAGIGSYMGTVYTFRLPCVMLSTSFTNYFCPAEEGTATVNASRGVPPYTYAWAPGGQTTDSVSGLSAGTYTVTVYDSTGCNQSAYFTILSVSTSLSISAFPDTVLLGDTAVLTANCNVPATYLWTPSGATTQSIQVAPLVTTTYTVIINTLCGTDSAAITVHAIPLPCSNHYNEPICIATIDTATNKCEVIWGRTNSPPQNGFGYYNVYRDSTHGYVSTHTQPLNVLSEYVDMNSNPSAGPVSYKLSTYDSCGESALSAMHTTIYLITTSTTNAYNLYWTPYIGFTPSKYRIFRGPALNAMMQIDSVPNTDSTYVDSFPPINSYYAVEAVNPFGVCIPTAKIKPHNVTSTTLSGSFSNGFNTAVLGVNSLSNSSVNMNIFPNPSNGTFTIQSSAVSPVPTESSGGQWSVTIYNELGQSVYTKTGTGKINEQVNLENVAEGIYTVRLQTTQGISVKKLVKIN